MIFDAGNEPGRYEWSDEENNTQWTPGTTTKAGGANVEPRSPIISARVTNGGIFFNTARAAHLVRYIGLPYVYEASDTRIAECPPPLSEASIIEVPEGLMWNSINGFWTFNGVGVYPTPCAIWEWIRDSINVDFSKYQAAMLRNPAKFEVWFSFVSVEASLPDRIAVFNYRDKNWSMGKISRICSAAFQSDINPLMSDGTTVYRHEVGFDYNGGEMPWAETFTINMGNGSVKSTIKKMLPEIIGSPSAVQFRFYKSINPTRQDLETISGIKTIRDNGFVDVRETASDFRMLVEMVAQEEWSFGLTEMDIVSRGRTGN
jgi:hypothetical protein